MSIEKDTLIFLHIPKTAGSTFHTILNKKYKRQQTRNLLGARYTTPSIAEFIQEPIESKTHIKMLKGHMPFGLHQYLPGSSSYIGFLRDPVDRIVSLYFYIIKNEKNPLHEAVAVNKMPLDEFVSSGIAIGTDNGQCRFINGDIDDYEFNHCDEALFEKVKLNLKEHFLWLGITERFDASILVLTHLMGWKSPPYYFRGNISKIRKKNSELKPDDLALIEQHNIYDRRLYEYANQLLDDHIKTIPDFEKKLLAYQLKNEKLQARWGWLPDTCRQWLT